MQWPLPENANNLNGYVCFFGQRRIEVRADTSRDAHQLAVQQFKVRPKQAHMVHVHLAERADGSEVIHTAS